MVIMPTIRDVLRALAGHGPRFHLSRDETWTSPAVSPTLPARTYTSTHRAETWDDATHAAPDDLAASDQRGDPIVAEANRRAFRREMPAAILAATDVERGSHGYESIRLVLDTVLSDDEAEIMLGFFRRLNDYWIADEQLRSEVEEEFLQQHWADYGHADMVTSCERVVETAAECFAAERDATNPALDPYAHRYVAELAETAERVGEHLAAAKYREPWGPFAQSYWSAMSDRDEPAEYIDPSAFGFPDPVADWAWTFADIAHACGITLPTRETAESTARAIGQIELPLP